MSDYRLSHQPDTSDESPRFHELDKAMPGFYDTPHQYVWELGTPAHLSTTQLGGHVQAIRQAMKARGNPESIVKLYRAVPRGVKEVNTGDWVTTSEQYAREHAMTSEDPEEDMDVIALASRAKNITFGGNDAFEFGYVGEPRRGHILRRSQ